MKRQIYIMLVSLPISLVLCESLLAWENKKTHPALTKEAIIVSLIDNYLENHLDIPDGINSQIQYDLEMYNSYIKKRMERGKVGDPENTTRSISGWLRTGSVIEDDDGRWPVPWRPRHHFHDPTRDAGLDNHTDHPDWEAPFWSSWRTNNDRKRKKQENR